MAKIIIKLGDITCEDTDAIVNAANESLLGGGFEEAELLRSAYKNSFLLAKEENLKTIAFPAISTGAYGYLIVDAARIALEVGRSFKDDFEEIRFICFYESDLAVYQRLEKERQHAGY